MADPKPTTTQAEQPPDPDAERLSRDAADSTYSEVSPPDDVYPPPGPMVEQTLGKPADRAARKK